MNQPGLTRKSVTQGRRRPAFARMSLYGFLVLALASWAYILAGTDRGLEDLFSGRTWSNAAGFLRQLLGIDGGLAGGGRQTGLQDAADERVGHQFCRVGSLDHFLAGGSEREQRRVRRPALRRTGRSVSRAAAPLRIHQSGPGVGLDHADSFLPIAGDIAGSDRVGTP